jgi:hypothetical protein
LPPTYPPSFSICSGSSRSLQCMTIVENP